MIYTIIKYIMIYAGISFFGFIAFLPIILLDLFDGSNSIFIIIPIWQNKELNIIGKIFFTILILPMSIFYLIFEISMFIFTFLFTFKPGKRKYY